MKKSTDEGFFTMEDTHEAMKVCRKEGLDGARAFAHRRIAAVASAKPENVAKAKAMVSRATTLDKLVLGIANFVLARESHSLKVIK